MTTITEVDKDMKIVLDVLGDDRLSIKDIVQNLISGIVVFTDRPFKIGDIIEVKKHKGKVKKIGIRTTTIVEESENLITIPNTMLVINPIKKFK
jgi:small-conductance mechanosensitive channel